MLIQNKQVAIVGGGPAGLTLARILQLNGACVKLYERDFNAAARIQGSPLDMHEESGAAALRKANLFEEFSKNIRVGADKRVILNERGEIVFSDHEKPEDFESARPEIDRGALRKIFLEALQPGTIVWDSHFVSMEKQSDGWVLQFKNGSYAYADIVVAADGANSRIRPYITGVKAFYSGFTMVEINIDDAAKATPRIYKLLNGGKVMAFGNEKTILGGQKGKGGLGFYASFKPGESWALHSGLDHFDRAQLLAWFKQEYCGWDSIWYELFENLTLPVIPRPIYCMPLDQTWEARPNLTMMGDAAHVMPPFAGEGANMAMLDALELAECFLSDTYSTLHKAIVAYEVNMRERASCAAQRSLENGERMHAEGALQNMLAILGIS